MSLVAFALLVIVFSQLIISNPHSGKAASSCNGNNCTITEKGYFFTKDDKGYFSKYLDNTSGALTLWDSATAKSVVIDGVEVASYDTQKFSNLTIQNHGMLTHDPLVRFTDFSGDKKTLTDNAKRKRVDIQVAGTIALNNGGRIDVDGKGYPGGQVVGENAENGWGPAGGEIAPRVYDEGASMCEFGPNNRNFCAWGAGGGGNNGKGGNGLVMPSGPTNFGGAATPTAFDYGSGGGGVRYFYDGFLSNAGERYPGGSGGGKIRIQTATLRMTKTSSITAKGKMGEAGSRHGYNFISAGAGAGGAIEIDADIILSSVDTLGPTVLAGKNPNRTQSNGSDGVRAVNGGTTQNTYLTNISASGGDVPLEDRVSGYIAGSGGGGKVKVNSQTGGNTVFGQNCYLELVDASYKDGNGDFAIPAICENNDVVVDGTTYKASHNGTMPKIYADGIAVWSDRTKSNYGNECYVAGSTTTNIANSSCDTRRRFESFTMIDAEMTHYPVTYSEYLNESVGNSLAGVTSGTGRLKKVDFDVTGEFSLKGTSKISVSGAGYSASGTNGAGPGYGMIAGVSGGTYWVGGGYGGAGGYGVPFSVFGATNPANFNPWNPVFDFGSAGAGGNSSLGDLNTGASGGGRVKVYAAKISLESTVSIEAKGNDSKSTYSAAGSGGMVWLSAYQFDFPKVATSVSYYGGGGSVAAGNGQVGIYNLLDYSGPSPALISVDGGASKSANANVGGGGGGRIIIQKISTDLAKVSKTITLETRPGVCDSSDIAKTPCTATPYAILGGDVLKIDLNVQNLAVGKRTKVIDEPLSDFAEGKYFCDGKSASMVPAYSTPIFNPNLVAEFTPIDSLPVTVSYTCTVRVNK